LWAHECLRVFFDRLVSNEDRALFYQVIDFELDNILETKYEKVRVKIKNAKDEELLVDPIFVDFLSEFEKAYDEVQDRSDLKLVIEEKLSEYNRKPQYIKMPLVLYQEAT